MNVRRIALILEDSGLQDLMIDTHDAYVELLE